MGLPRSGKRIDWKEAPYEKEYLTFLLDHLDKDKLFKTRPVLSFRVKYWFHDKNGMLKLCVFYNHKFLQHYFFKTFIISDIEEIEKSIEPKVLMQYHLLTL